MPDLLPIEKRMDFFVYIIESPSPVDLYHQRSEGEMLQQAVKLNQVNCILRLTVNSDAFIAALTIGLEEAMQKFAPSKPIIHISAHGSNDGIELSSKEFISWGQLRELLIPINRKLLGSLIVCMSTCEGYSGCRMAMHTDSKEHPFFAVIGNSSKPTWPETAIGFATVYHLIKNGFTVVDAVAAMRVASGNHLFFAERAEDSKQLYLDYVSQKLTEPIQPVIEQNDTQEESIDVTKKYKLIDGEGL